MSGEHFPGGIPKHTPQGHLSDEAFAEVQKNVVYSCIDIAFRNKQSGQIFLANRTTEPQQGPWFVGGRRNYGESPLNDLFDYLENDLGISNTVVASTPRFIGSYSTSFAIADSDKENYGRHTDNMTFIVNLDPSGVDEFNKVVSETGFSTEYNGGSWIDPEIVVDPHSDFPSAIKQFVRDMYANDRGLKLDEFEAYEENKLREKKQADKQKEDYYIKTLSRWNFSGDDADRLIRIASVYSLDAVIYARYLTDMMKGIELEEKENKAKIFLSDILEKHTDRGDYSTVKFIRESGIVPPIGIYSQNGPRLKMTLAGAKEVIKIDLEQSQSIFSNLPVIDPETYATPIDN